MANIEGQLTLLKLLDLQSAGDDGDGHWVTIDGAHVFIKNGKIEKGPRDLVNKSMQKLGVNKPAWKSKSTSKAKLESMHNDFKDKGYKYKYSVKHDSGKTSHVYAKTDSRGRSKYGNVVERGNGKHYVR